MIRVVVVDDEQMVCAHLRTILGYRSQSPFIQLYLDVTFGANIGNALNSAIADQFAGQATPQQVVDKISEAAKQK